MDGFCLRVAVLVRGRGHRICSQTRSNNGADREEIGCARHAREGLAAELLRVEWGGHVALISIPILPPQPGSRYRPSNIFKRWPLTGVRVCVPSLKCLGKHKRQKQPRT